MFDENYRLSKEAVKGNAFYSCCLFVLEVTRFFSFSLSRHTHKLLYYYMVYLPMLWLTKLQIISEMRKLTVHFSGPIAFVTGQTQK